MQQSHPSSRFTHKVTLLQQELQLGKITNEEYHKKLNTAVEEEVHSEETVKQDARRGSLWIEVKNSWENIENERKHREQQEREQEIKRIEALEKSKLEEENKIMLQSQRAEEEKLRPYTRYIHNVIDIDLTKMREDSRRYRKWYNFFQGVIIIGSILATTIVNIEGLPRWVTAIFSAIVGIASGFVVAFKFKDRSYNLQETADTIEYEYHLFELMLDNYDIDDNQKRYKAFARRIENLKQEQRQREQVLEQSSEPSTQVQPAQTQKV